MLTDQQFDKVYGAIYEKEYKNALNYVNNPVLLKNKILREQKLKDNKKIIPPYPDPFAYQITRYRGFVKYPDRLKNFIISGNEAPHKQRSFLPHIIDLEPNANCNYRCVMCHVSEWENGKRTEDLELKSFYKFIENNPQLTEVKLHGMGEPLLHPDYFKMVSYLVEKDIWVRTSTNASLLHARDNAKRLIDTGIGEIQVSFDGATKDVYEKIRRKGRFDLVKNNCILLNDYANRQERLYTRMWVVVQKYNRHQLLELVELASKMGFRRLSFSLFLNEWGLDSWKEKNKKNQTDYGLSQHEEQKLLEKSLSEGIELTIWRQSGKYQHNNLEKICPWVFKRPYISCDLKVVPCAMIANPDVYSLGSAVNMEDTWGSDRYVNFRQSHLYGDIPDMCKLCYV